MQFAIQACTVSCNPLTSHSILDIWYVMLLYNYVATVVTRGQWDAVYSSSLECLILAADVPVAVCGLILVLFPYAHLSIKSYKHCTSRGRVGWRLRIYGLSAIVRN